MILGNVGAGAASEFSAFLKVQSELPPLENIFNGEDYVPTKLDLKYALVSALAIRAKESQYNRLLQYSKVLSEEFSVLMVKMLISRNRQIVGKCQLWPEWARDHRDIVII